MKEQNPLNSKRYIDLKNQLNQLASEFENIGTKHSLQMSKKIFKLTDTLDEINGENVNYHALFHQS